MTSGTEQRHQQLDRPGNAERVPVASGSSCLEQIDALLAREPVHPVELLDPERDPYRQTSDRFVRRLPNS
jgi:hypothetical protein